MTRERRGGATGVPWRQFVVGAALMGAAIFVAVTRENASEALVGTLGGLGLLAMGVAIPKVLPRFTVADKDKEDETE